MNISWLGHAAVKLTGKEATVVIDPYSDSVGFAMPRVSGDIVLCSTADPAHGASDEVKGDPFVITGPGEYELKGVFIYGIAETENKIKSTLYVVEMEGLTIAHLGSLKQTKFTEDQSELLANGIDILLLPVGDTDLLTPEQAMDVIQTIEPRVVIPISYAVPGLKHKAGTLEAFFKEAGVKIPEAIDKYKITDKELPQTETQYVVLAKE